MSAELAVQKAIREKLIASIALTAIVPASSILDTHKQPAPRPAIILGEGQVFDVSDIKRTRQRIIHVAHVFIEELSLETCKRVMGLMSDALLRTGRPDLSPGFHCADYRVTSTRSMRDPDGVTSHGVFASEFLVVRT